MSSPPRVHVVCFGNPWHGDDGFGLHVFRRLRAWRAFTDLVSAFDAGVAGLAALPYFEGCAKAVIVNAVRSGGRVGTVHRLAAPDLAPAVATFSLHDVGVNDLVAALGATGRAAPEIVLIGAEAGEIRAFAGRLSAPVKAAVPAATHLVVRECLGSAPGGRSPRCRGSRSRCAA